VAVDREILVAIAHLGIEMEVDGHRADLVTRKAAQAVAAHEGRDRVTLDDVEGVAPMVLAHRVKPTAGSRRGLADIGEILRSAGDGPKGRGR
jgi:Mg-chelatase subunit ChlI